MIRDDTGRPLDLVVLRTFVAVMEEGGFTAAGERLHLAQSTVSAHLARLEETVGTPLLSRGRGAVTATPTGERLLAHARQLLRQNALAWQEIRGPRVDGVVRLGIPDDYIVYLPEALADFEARFPGVDLQVSCGLSVDLVAEVRAGALDVAVVTRQPRSPGGEMLRREPLVWAGSVGHETHRRAPLPLALSREGVCIFRDSAVAALAAAGQSWRVAYTSASLAGLCTAVRSGLAITVVTPSMLGPGLRVLGQEDGLPELPAVEVALHRSPGRPSEAARQLAAHLQERLDPARVPEPERV
ncbi:MAG: LysR substrate-binding domain-containing protein [Ectothiorhodospiraceae bacterium]